MFISLWSDILLINGLWLDILVLGRIARVLRFDINFHILVVTLFCSSVTLLHGRLDIVFLLIGFSVLFGFMGHHALTREIVIV